MTWGARLAVASFVLAQLALPLCLVECFPFSMLTMSNFRSGPSCRYRAWDEDGRPIARHALKLHRSVGVDPEPPGGFGRSYGPGLAEFGLVAGPTRLVGHVQDALRAYPRLRKVVVEQEVWGPQQGRLVLLRRQTFAIDNPWYRP